MESQILQNFVYLRLNKVMNSIEHFEVMWGIPQNP